MPHQSTDGTLYRAQLHLLVSALGRGAIHYIDGRPLRGHHAGGPNSRSERPAARPAQSPLNDTVPVFADASTSEFTGSASSTAMFAR